MNTHTMHSKLVTKEVVPTIISMAIPMLAGTFAMNMYNLTNAWFVSKLGTNALAAISFTVPVTMLLMLFIRGLGAGSLTLVAHAIGKKEARQASTLTSHSLLLALFFALCIGSAGILTIHPVFSALGATGSVLALITKYMKVWYLGSVVMVLQMISFDIIMGTGNTRLMSFLMVLSTVINALLDWCLIFGKCGAPQMGIVGAAVATLISQTLTLIVALVILKRKLGLINFAGHKVRAILSSWGRILTFGIPSALGMLLTPLSSAIIIRMIAHYGNAAVAASGVAGRIEMFAFMIPMTVGMSLIPFVAQNYGAHRMDRIREARKKTMQFAVAYGVFIAIVFMIIIGPMARFFSTDAAVISVLRNYIFITCAGFGFLEVHRYAGFCMTGVHEPLQSSFLNVYRILVLLIPLSLIGNTLLNLNGIFWARLVTDILAGVTGIFWSGIILVKKESMPKKSESAEPQEQMPELSHILQDNS